MGVDRKSEINVRVWKKKILIKIFGPVNEQGSSRRFTKNCELCLGNVREMSDERLPKKIMNGKLFEMRGRPR